MGLRTGLIGALLALLLWNPSGWSQQSEICQFPELMNILPRDGETVGATPTLEIDIGFEPDAFICEHHYTQWLITDDENFEHIVFDSGADPENLYHIEVPKGVLQPGGMYYWTARWVDEERQSQFSPPTGFFVEQDEGEEEEPPVEVFNPTTPSEVRSEPVIFPGATERVRVSFEVVDGFAIFEGDIILGQVGLLEPNSPAVQTVQADGLQGIGLRTTAGALWPNGVMPFTVAGGFSPDQQSQIVNAMQHIQANTSITFVQRTTESDYVAFTPGGGCSSYVGRIGGKQEINLHPNCGFGSTVHEISHALGIFHEQSRCDRDNFVTILFLNITPGRENNFQNACAAGTDIGAYDFGSIMHYPATAFSVNGQPTILTNPPGAPIGQRNGLSAGDVGAIASLYGPGGPQPVPGNNNPTVSLSASAQTATPADTVELSAQGQDPDGDQLAYEWFLNDTRQVVSDPLVAIRNPPVGVYNIRVRVSDGNGGAAEDAVTITISDTPQPGPGPGPGPVTLSIEQALDQNANTFIDDDEIIRAIQFWILGATVPDTGGQTISDGKMLELLRLWILGESFM